MELTPKRKLEIADARTKGDNFQQLKGYNKYTMHYY